MNGGHETQQDDWISNGWMLVLIIVTFAIQAALLVGVVAAVLVWT